MQKQSYTGCVNLPETPLGNKVTIWSRYCGIYEKHGFGWVKENSANIYQKVLQCSLIQHSYILWSNKLITLDVLQNVVKYLAKYIYSKETFQEFFRAGEVSQNKGTSVNI